MSDAPEIAHAAAPALADLIERARAATQGGDQKVALGLWTEARQHFPDNPIVWLRCAELLMAQRRLPEADSLLQDAVARFPAHFWLARAYAYLARDEGDEHEAYTRFRCVRQAFPDEPAAHASFVHLLVDQKRTAAAEAEAEASLARFPDDVWLRHMHALCAEQAGDIVAAAVRWIEVLIRHPDHAQAYPAVVQALIAQDRLDEAAGIVRAGERLLGDSAPLREAREAIDKALPSLQGHAPSPAASLDLLTQAARAEADANWPEAARLWSGLLAVAPDLARAHAGTARALRRLGRVAEAEIVLAKARRDLPPDAGVLRASADGAVERNDLVSALTRFQALRAELPRDREVEFSIAHTLHALGRLEEADAAFAVLAKSQPLDLPVVQEYAQIASERGDDTEALRRWTQVTMRSPALATGYRCLADTLLRVGRTEDADRTLCKAVGQVKDNLEITLRWAMSGQAAGDAAARLKELCRRFPDLASLVSVTAAS